MINHSTKSPLRRHKDVSPGAKLLLSVRRRWFTARLSGRVRARLSPSESENCLEMPSWQRAQDKVRRTYEKLQYGHVSLTMTTTTTTSLLLSVAIMAIRSVTHSINHTDCRFVYPPGLERGLKQQYLSPPAVHFPSLSLCKPRLISAFQLSLILLLHCPPHKELWANFTSVLSCWKFLPTLSAISVPESWLCGVALVNSVPFWFFLEELRGNCWFNERRVVSK